jgi:hypothetical protein
MHTHTHVPTNTNNPAHYYTNTDTACEEGLGLIYERLIANNNGHPIVAVFSDQPRLDERALRRAFKNEYLRVLLDIFHAIQDLKTCGYATSPCFRAMVRELSECYLHRVPSDVLDHLTVLQNEDDVLRVKKGLDVLTGEQVAARLVRFKRKLTYHRPFQVSVCTD